LKAINGTTTGRDFSVLPVLKGYEKVLKSSLPFDWEPWVRTTKRGDQWGPCIDLRWSATSKLSVRCSYCPLA